MCANDAVLFDQNGNILQVLFCTLLLVLLTVSWILGDAKTELHSPRGLPGTHKHVGDLLGVPGCVRMCLAMPQLINI